MPVYGKLNTSEMLVTDRKLKFSEGWIKAFESKDRPTSDHVMSIDGLWILPKPTKESVAKQRESRYRELGADEILADIVRDRELGRDVTEQKTRWLEIQAQVREELPYPSESAIVQTYYQPVK